MKKDNLYQSHTVLDTTPMDSRTRFHFLFNHPEMTQKEKVEVMIAEGLVSQEEELKLLKKLATQAVGL